MEKSKKIIIALSVVLILLLAIIVGFIIKQYVIKGELIVEEKDLICTIEYDNLFCRDRSFKPFSGVVINKHPNGRISSYVHYRNGKPDIEGKLYFDNGQLDTHTVYENSNIKKMLLYRENGKLLSEMVVSVRDKREGNVVHYYEDGKVAILGTVRVPSLETKSRDCFDKQAHPSDCKKVLENLALPKYMKASYQH